MIGPSEIRAPRSARTLEIDWEDGRTTVHRNRDLRAFCPCANCQGHQGAIRWAIGAGPWSEELLRLDAIEPVGQYALRLRWGDGHQTGIYPFPYLRELGVLFELAEEEVRTQSFRR